MQLFYVNNCTNKTVKTISRNELIVLWGVHMDE